MNNTSDRTSAHLQQTLANLQALRDALQELRVLQAATAAKPSEVPALLNQRTDTIREIEAVGRDLMANLCVYFPHDGRTDLEGGCIS